MRDCIWILDNHGMKKQWILDNNLPAMPLKKKYIDHFIYIYIYVYRYIEIKIYAPLYVYLFIYLSIYLSIDLFIYILSTYCTENHSMTHPLELGCFVGCQSPNEGRRAIEHNLKQSN